MSDARRLGWQGVRATRGGRPLWSAAARACAPGGGAAALACLAASCTSDLFSTDYEPVVAPERTRIVRPLELEAWAAGDVDEPRAGDAPSGAAYESRFAGLAEVEITLAEARAAALANNLDLQVALIDPAIAQEALSFEEAAFDAMLFVDAQHAETDRPTASELTSAQQEFTSISPGLRIPLPTGGAFEIVTPISRTETNNRFATLNPAWTSDLELSLSHSLLEGAGVRVNTAAIRIAGYNRQIAEAQTKLAVIREVAATDRAYWRLYEARQRLEVSRAEYELALAQLDRARREFQAERVAQIDVTRAEAGVAQRIVDVIGAEEAALRAQRELKRLMNIEDLAVGSPQVVVPATPPEPLRYRLEASELAGLAQERRMELLELELRQLADLANVEVARNALLPTLDARATWRVNGLGPAFSDAAEQAWDNDFEDWSVGVRAEAPLGNRQARARVREALLVRLQRLASERSRRQLVTQEVYDAVDAIETGWQQILAARQSVALNSRQLEAEQRLFAVGRSDSNDVLAAIAALAQARLAEVTAVVDYQLAQIDLAQATGSLLGAARVRWEPSHHGPASAAPGRAGAG